MGLHPRLQPTGMPLSGDNRTGPFRCRLSPSPR